MCYLTFIVLKNQNYLVAMDKTAKNYGHMLMTYSVKAMQLDKHILVHHLTRAAARWFPKSGNTDKLLI